MHCNLLKGGPAELLAFGYVRAFSGLSQSTMQGECREKDYCRQKDDCGPPNSTREAQRLRAKDVTTAFHMYTGSTRVKKVR